MESSEHPDFGLEHSLIHRVELSKFRTLAVLAIREMSELVLVERLRYRRYFCSCIRFDVRSLETGSITDVDHCGDL